MGGEICGPLPKFIQGDPDRPGDQDDQGEAPANDQLFFDDLATKARRGVLQTKELLQFPGESKASYARGGV